MEQYPEMLFGFAYIPDFNGRLEDLAGMAEAEDWSYHYTPNDHPNPILYSYVQHTYRRVAQQESISTSRNGDFACFNTGLVTPHQEPIYASFQVNLNDDAQPWYFTDWLREGESRVNQFPELPAMATYFEEPSDLFYDTKKQLRRNMEHFIENEETRSRFPDPFGTMQPRILLAVLNQAIDSAEERVHRSYKAAIPQFYNDRIQLLLPLCLNDPQKADLALVVDTAGETYRATTCLTLDMAYNNARLLAKPDRDWLQP